MSVCYQAASNPSSVLSQKEQLSLENMNMLEYTETLNRMSQPSESMADEHNLDIEGPLSLV